MTYEIYNYIFIGAAIVSAVLLVISVVLFFTLKIPKVISDLTGRTEREGVENIRKQNELSGDKSYKSSSVNLKRGKLTDKISKSGRIAQPSSGAFSTGASTEKIATRGVPHQAAPAARPDENQTMVLGTPSADATTVLTDENQTVVLNASAADATTVLASEQTTLLAQDEGTTLLYNPDPRTAPAVPQNVFEVELEITYIHTNVMIGWEAR